MSKRILFPFIALLAFQTFVFAQGNPKIEKLANQIETEVLELRRHFHQFPELSNREFKTAERIAEELRN